MNRWTITYRGQTGSNGSWKIIARRGSIVVHVDRLTEKQASEWTQP